MYIKQETLAEKLDLIQWISTIEDESIIKKLLELREKETKEWWNKIPEEEKNSINRGIEDADNQALTPYSEVRKIYEKWL